MTVDMPLQRVADVLRHLAVVDHREVLQVAQHRFGHGQLDLLGQLFRRAHGSGSPPAGKKIARRALAGDISGGRKPHIRGGGLWVVGRLGIERDGGNGGLANVADPGGVDGAALGALAVREGEAGHGRALAQFCTRINVVPREGRAKFPPRNVLAQRESSDHQLDPGGGSGRHAPVALVEPEAHMLLLFLDFAGQCSLTASQADGPCEWLFGMWVHVARY